ncbi:MAG: dihydroorotase [Alphaproteobacteria bacterium]
MSGRTAIINARLVDPASGLDAPGALLIEDGRIADLGPRLFADAPPADAEVIDAGGQVLGPGLIDMRVFTGEPGAEHRETLASASQSAAAGGVTTMIVMPDTDPVIDEPSLVDFVLRRARDTAVVRVHPMAALTRDHDGRHMTEMGLLAEAGAVAFTDGNRAVADSLVMRRALTYARTFGMLIAHHVEDPALASAGVMNEGEFSTRLGLAGRPAIAERIMLERDLSLVWLTGARYHVSQISCAMSLPPLERAREHGLPVTAAASAHHLALNEIDIGNYRTFFKVSPPLRAEDDRAAMVRALSDGLIDVVVSSHEPRAPEDKRLPFAEAADGAVGLETLLPVLLELVHNGALTLTQALRTVTCRPAEILGLEGGRLEKGAPADLVLIDVDRPFVLDGEALRSRSKNTPFDGRRLQGRAVRTFVSGKTVFQTE